MSTAEMEQRDYELEIIRMEFMDKISEIAREALESQKKLIVHTDTDFPLSNASDWVTNQSEFITKLINNWKGNELFRDLVGKKMNNLDTIDKNVNDLEFIDTIMPSIGNAGTRIGFAGSHNGRVSDPNASYFYISETLNRCLRQIGNRQLTAGAENLPQDIRYSLIDDMINSFICNKMPHIGAAVNLLPFIFIHGEGGPIKPSLTYFQKYFSCYCRCLTGLLQSDSSSSSSSSSDRGGGDKKDNIIGGKKTHKKRKTKK